MRDLASVTVSHYVEVVNFGVPYVRVSIPQLLRKVPWNNCFRKIFNACWRESAKPLLYYSTTLPASLLID